MNSAKLVGTLSSSTKCSATKSLKHHALRHTDIHTHKHPQTQTHTWKNTHKKLTNTHTHTEKRKKVTF